MVQRSTKTPVQITAGQARNIFKETFPKCSPTVQQVAILERGINMALVWVTPVGPKHRLPKPARIETALRRLKIALTPIDRWFLEATGRAYRRQHDAKENISGYASFDDFVTSIVNQLDGAVNEALKWLGDSSNKHGNLVMDSLQNESLQTLICVFLPIAFEMTFPGKKCGTGREGPGMRFIVAVLREAKLRSGNSYDADVEMVKTARSREKKRSLKPTQPKTKVPNRLQTS